MKKTSLYKNKKCANKIFDIFKRVGCIIRNNLNYIIVMIAMTSLSVFMIVSEFRGLDISIHSNKAMIIIAIFIALTIIIGTVLYWARKNKWKIEKVYLFVALVLGIFYIAALPIGATPDETGHFMRSYELAEGRIIPESGTITVPENIKNVVGLYDEDAYINIKNNASIVASSDYYSSENTISGYAPINYIPQIVGIWIGKILHLPLIPMMYLARLLNMIFCVVIIYFCIKYIPILKKMVFLIGMFPMTMQLFASVAADGSIICAGIALVTYVLYTRKTMKRKLKFWDFLLLLVLCLMLTMTKPIYALLCPIVFWIPKERFKSIKHKIWSILILGGVTLGLVIIKMISAPLVVDLYGAAESQKQVILHNPLYVLWISLKGAILLPEGYIYGLTGRLLEWFSIDIYMPYIITIFIIFVLLCAELKEKVTKSMKIFAILSFVAIILLTFMTEFVIWSPPGSENIEGVQSRYFLPILLLIPLSLMPIRNIKKTELVRLRYLYPIMTLINVYAITIIICNHV